MDVAIRRRGYGMLDHPVNHPGLPAGLSQPIPVDRDDSAAADGECRPVRMERQPEISFPEVAVPSIVVPSDHYDWKAAPQPGQCRGYMEPAPGNDPGVGEPEVEQVAIDEQAIAQGWDRIEKLEQRLLGFRGANAKMGIRHDYESPAEHGAKDGGLLRWVQRERACRILV